MRRAGVGRLTHQYNPQGGAKSVGQWLTAVTSMKGENGAMSVPDAVAMIRATSPAKRSEYAEEIWKTRKARGNPMSFSVKDVEYDSGVNKTYGVVVTPVFTDRYSVSGRASAREFKDLVAYTVEKRMARDNPNPVKRYAASQVEAIEKVTAKSQDFGSTLESEWTTGGKVMMIWRAPTGHRVLVTIGRDGSYYGSKLSEGTRMKANQSEAMIRKHAARDQQLYRLLQRAKEQIERLNIKWVDAYQKYGEGSPQERAADRKVIAANKREDAIKKQLYKEDLSFGRSRRNPETESADSYEKFHGFRPKERITVKKKIRYHENLWAVGKLEKLVVISPDGVQVMIDGFKGAMLSANEANTQLYIEGGDQSVNLADFGLGEPYHDKEDLGEIEKLYYFTNKTHLGDQGGEAVYHHTLGEERTKRDYLFGKLKGRKVPRPRLVYDVMNQALEIIGGEYVIEPEGIRN
jgi:hypothetical protein